MYQDCKWGVCVGFVKISRHIHINQKILWSEHTCTFQIEPPGCGSFWDQICGNPDQNYSIYRNIIRWFRTAKMHRTIIVFLQANSIEKPGFRSARDPFIYFFFGQGGLALIRCSGPPPPLIFQIWGGKVGFLRGTKVGFYRPCRDFAQDYSAAARRVMFTGRIQLYLTCIVPVLNQ